MAEDTVTLTKEQLRKLLLNAHLGQPDMTEDEYFGTTGRYGRLQAAMDRSDPTFLQTLQEQKLGLPGMADAMVESFGRIKPNPQKEGPMMGAINSAGQYLQSLSPEPVTPEELISAAPRVASKVGTALYKGLVEPVTQIPNQISTKMENAQEEEMMRLSTRNDFLRNRIYRADQVPGRFRADLDPNTNPDVKEYMENAEKLKRMGYSTKDLQPGLTR